MQINWLEGDRLTLTYFLTAYPYLDEYRHDKSHLFDKYVKEPIRQNPDLLYKKGWK